MGQAAILSPLFKVREFKVEDTSAFPVNVGWRATDEQGKDVGDKTATVFPEKSMMNILKLLTFYRQGPFDIKAHYADTALLLPGTTKELGTYRVELPPQSEQKTVKVKAKMT